MCQSVSPSIGPLFGSPAGPSTEWMHRCLPVRLVFCKLSLYFDYVTSDLVKNVEMEMAEPVIGLFLIVQTHNLCDLFKI